MAWLENQYLQSVSSSRKSPSYKKSFLHYQVFEDYFKDVEEESIRDNFVIVYELLDELVDFGYPQTTDGKILQE